MSATTRNDRIHRLLAKVHPAAAARHAKDGTWLGGQAPYAIDQAADGQRRLTICSADGDVFRASGPTLDAAIAAMEAKLGVAEVANA